MPFTTSEQALENARAANDCIVTDELKQFLLENFPKKKSENCKLGCADRIFSQKIKDILGIGIIVGDFLVQLSRAIREHLDKYLDIPSEDIIKSQLGLGHSYSRMKCMFDVNRQDKPIIQTIALIELLDKDINSFCMRIKEWFGWHFPELSTIVKNNYVYVRIAKLIEGRDNLLANKNELIPKITEITLDEEVTKEIMEAAAISMGSEIAESDLLNVKFFSEKVAMLIKYRENLSSFLTGKMKKLAPNTYEIVGEILSAKLISHAGSLCSLAKYPASTIQILGAEKALFRALKTKSKTPKYGLLYNSTYIGKAKQKNKGKISRFLANKLAMTTRIDYFSNNRLNTYGVELKKQIEERLNYLETGVKPRKNKEVMEMIYNKIEEQKQETKNEEKENEGKGEVKLLSKKKKKDTEEIEEDQEEAEKPKKKKKKVQKEEQEEDDEAKIEKPKKKKKKDLKA